MVSLGGEAEIEVLIHLFGLGPVFSAPTQPWYLYGRWDPFVVI